MLWVVAAVWCTLCFITPFLLPFELWISSLVALIGIIAVFWAFLYILWPNKRFPQEADFQLGPDEAEEIENLQEDLEVRAAIRRVDPRGRVNRPHSSPPSNGKVSKETLLNLGIAENETNGRRDTAQAHPGYTWLCDGRWLIFPLITLFLAGPLVWFTSWILLFWFAPLLACTASSMTIFILVTTWLAWRCWVSVKENNRAGVKRFGKQLPGYLSPGLHFLVFPYGCKAPRRVGIELAETVPLEDLVWGPEPENKEIKQESRINGSLGTPQNPSPGKFEVLLLARWPIMITLVITLRVFRQYPQAWNQFLNEFRDPDEIGERIASVSTGVLTTRARELQGRDAEIREQVLNEIREQGRDINPSDPREKAKLKDEVEIEIQIRLLLEFVNQIPEISGDILSALVKHTNQQLGGLLILGVIFASVDIDEGFQRMYQELDQARVARLTEMMRGEAITHRLRELQRLFNIEGVGLEQQSAAFAEAHRNETMRLFAEKETGIDGFLAALTGMAAQRATRTTTPE